MNRFIKYLNKKNGKQLKFLYIENIIEDSLDQYLSAVEQIINSDYTDFDKIIFKYKNGLENVFYENN